MMSLLCGEAEEITFREDVVVEELSGLVIIKRLMLSLAR